MAEWVIFGQQKIKVGVISFISMPLKIADVLFCNDYFKIAPPFQGSPNYWSIFYPNPSPGWLVQGFTTEKVMRM